MEQVSNIKNNKGCFAWVLLICSVLLIIMQVSAIKEKNEHKQYSSDVNAYTLRQSTDTSLNIIAIGVFGVVIMFCINSIVKKNKSNMVEPSMHINSTKSIQVLKTQAQTETNALKKRILNHCIGVLTKKEAEQRLIPLIKDCERDLAVRNNPELAQRMQQFKDELEKAQIEASVFYYDILAELSDDEKECYAAFCESFKTLCNSEKIWLVTKRERNSEQKSFANSLVEKKKTRFFSGFLYELQMPYEIPVLSVNGGKTCYFYPRFVVVADNTDFSVMPIFDVNLIYGSCDFMEDDVVPSDAITVGNTYQYVNKNGEKDKRYSINPSYPVVRYGQIQIEPFDTEFMVSNDSSTNDFCKSFKALKSAYTANNNFNYELENPSNNGRDSLFEEAARLFVENQKCSGTLLMRKFSIGYNRAGKIVDQLEDAGIVGKFNGISNTREVLVPDEPTLNLLLKTLESKPYDVYDTNDKEKTEKIYEDYRVVVKRTIDIADWMKLNTAFKKSLNNVHISFNDKTIKNKDQLINVLIELDFLKCFLKLGKQLDFEDIECLGMLMLTAALNNEMIIKLDEAAVYQKKLNQTMLDFYMPLQKAIEQNPEPEGGFIISQLLGDFDKKMQLKYLITLHRFSTIVAGIDNNISDEEQAGIDYVSEKYSGAEFDDAANNDSSVDSENASSKALTAKPKRKSRSHKAADELRKLIGLQSVKSEVETLTNFIKIQQSRAEKGLKATSVSYHCVFTGNPGTGKTTVARIVANIYKELGVLKKGHLVETDRSGLVAEYVGQTAVKTNKVIDCALDGVLFIDEAYSLVSGGQNDFGIEAISTLLKRMEDDRDRLVVILAGYSNEMQTFINANPGLQSRFNRYIEFPDYSADELAQIFEFNLTKNEYTITDDAKTALTAYLNNVVATKDERFGNARFVRNLFEKTIERQANRLAQEKQLTAEMLTTIELADLAV